MTTTRILKRAPRRVWYYPSREAARSRIDHERGYDGLCVRTTPASKAIYFRVGHYDGHVCWFWNKDQTEASLYFSLGCCTERIDKWQHAKLAKRHIAKRYQEDYAAATRRVMREVWPMAMDLPWLYE